MKIFSLSSHAPALEKNANGVLCLNLDSAVYHEIVIAEDMQAAEAIAGQPVTEICEIKEPVVIGSSCSEYHL